MMEVILKLYEIKFLVDSIIDTTFIKAESFTDAVKQANYLAGLSEGVSVYSVKEVTWLE